VIGEAIEEDERDGGKYFHISVRENDGKWTIIAET
jgi:hypothetical protein